VLRQMYGNSTVPEPKEQYRTNWGLDPFSWGAYSFPAVNQVKATLYDSRNNDVHSWSKADLSPCSDIRSVRYPERQSATGHFPGACILPLYPAAASATDAHHLKRHRFASKMYFRAPTAARSLLAVPWLLYVSGLTLSLCRKAKVRSGILLRHWRAYKQCCGFCGLNL
jgi:hypothetical protein